MQQFLMLFLYKRLVLKYDHEDRVLSLNLHLRILIAVFVLFTCSYAFKKCFVWPLKLATSCETGCGCGFEIILSFYIKFGVLLLF